MNTPPNPNTNPQDEIQFLALWDLAWKGACDHPAPPAIQGSDDSVTQAINSAPGKLTQALLTKLWSRNLPRGSGFPEDLKSRLLGLVSGEKSSNHLARVILASRLYSIHALSPEWATKELIARMLYPDATATEREAKEKEATALWTGFASSPRIGPSLLEDLKGALVGAAPKLAQIPNHFRTQLVYAISELAAEAPSALGERQLQGVFSSFTESELIDCAEHYRMKLEAAEVRAPDLWNKSIKSVFKNYWPVIKELVTDETSNSLGRMLLATREAFPEALKTISEPGLLRSIQDPVLILSVLSKPERFEKKKEKTPEDEDRVAYDIADRHPEATLAFLDNIVDDEIVTWARSELGSVLTKLLAKQPAIDRDAAYQRLYGISRHG